jgi:hypothetical protein
MSAPTYDDEFLKTAQELKKRLPCCPNCFYFNVKTERCELAPQQPIPARVIAFGCASFDFCPF